MKTDDFKIFWQKGFGENVPLGYVLRGCVKERWVRFYNLPKGKRYAETEAEEKKFLYRVNVLGTRIFGGGTECWMVLSLPESESEVPDSQTLREFALSPACDWESKGDLSAYTTYTVDCRWRPREYDAIFKRVANDEESGILWVSKEGGYILAPYDGGIDIIAPSKDEADSLRSSFPEWLSDHPEGL